MNDRWDLSFLYAEGFDDPAFIEDLEALPTEISNAQALLEGSLPPAEKLESFMDALERIAVRMEKVSSLTYMNQAVDAENTVAARYMDKISLLMNELELVESAVQRYVGSLDNLDEVISASPKLQELSFVLHEMAEQAHHTIPADLEPWLLKMSLSGGFAFSQLRDKLDSTHKINFRGETLPLSAVRGKAYDADAATRKEAYEAEIASYSAIELPMSFCLGSIKLEARTLAEVKGYSSVLDMTLQESRMDQQTLDAMWCAIREYLPDFRRYLRMKGRLLGHEDGLPFYDLFAPIGKAGRTYTVEEAKEKLMTELGKFSPEMAEFIGHAFDARWIDLYPRNGKTGGAFCSPVHYADRSLVMTNFQGSFSDVSTIAHELGHAWHNRCMAGLPYALIDTPMQLAETASIFNETMLSHQVLSSCTNEEEMTLLEAGLMEATQTVVDIYSRFLFEQEVIDTRADHNMTVDELKDATLRAQDASYGDGLAKDCRHPYMWACKSHYYSSGLNYYNFPYAFGLLFGKGVFAQWLREGDSFVPKYCRMLRSCGSDTIAGVAASVGIDVHSPDFWRSSLEVIRQDINRFCELAEASMA